MCVVYIHIHIYSLYMWYSSTIISVYYYCLLLKYTPQYTEIHSITTETIRVFKNNIRMLLVLILVFFFLPYWELPLVSQLFLPTIARFLVLTAPQSPLHEENLDQLVNWQSSWHGIWQACVRAGTGPACWRHSWMLACPPSCFRQVMAKRKACV